MNIPLSIASYWIKYLNPQLALLTQPIQGWFYTVSPQGELTINLIALIVLGLAMGFLAGCFGVGSGFLMAPLLNLFGNIPFNVAIGSDLTYMVGSATIANLRQRAVGYVDYKLGLLLFLGSALGVEVGAQFLELLKYAGKVSLLGHRSDLMQLTMTAVYALMLGWIGTTVYRETWAIRRLKTGVPAPAPPAVAVGSRLQTISLPPMVALPVSGVEAISLWLILGVGFVSGLLTGFLGVSGAFIRMPALIYVLGVPTVVSLGTNLFELLILALYGALTHSLKGNVDLILVMILLITTTVGNQLGVLLQTKIVGWRSLLLYTAIIFSTILFLLLKLIS
ncbi:MAG: sulfite exporter TauE/SafE family protein [Deltaproteobacteria bacterium]|nr:sulfite exporter TauE/SafE family protein [Deltaproteobacteria bacterium]MBW1951772.1 sulfite exporter TauE/SafE family protein [Deltaproteobacteria bacterium]MBW1986832.1 sulfite exporter TauE/SafE family protein [Deltaproteobacteria bacterium]MBW2134955.1 sulfite exporter TauE/SafE family protein [Deltaproteobacteria bacterium]